MTSGEIWDSVY